MTCIYMPLALALSTRLSIPLIYYQPQEVTFTKDTSSKVMDFILLIKYLFEKI